MGVNVPRTLAVIAVCAVCTLLERALPFLIFRGREVPKVVKNLGAALPAAIITTLIVYCLRSYAASAAIIPQLIACAVTVGLHLWKRNSFLSIFGGTAVCMLLTQFVF